jgi:hypothetical protein
MIEHSPLKLERQGLSSKTSSHTTFTTNFSKEYNAMKAINDSMRTMIDTSYDIPAADLEDLNHITSIYELQHFYETLFKNRVSRYGREIDYLEFVIEEKASAAEIATSKT